MSFVATGVASARRHDGFSEIKKWLGASNANETKLEEKNHEHDPSYAIGKGRFDRARRKWHCAGAAGASDAR